MKSRPRIVLGRAQRGHHGITIAFPGPFGAPVQLLGHGPGLDLGLAELEAVVRTCRLEQHLEGRLHVEVDQSRRSAANPWPRAASNRAGPRVPGHRGPPAPLGPSRGRTAPTSTWPRPTARTRRPGWSCLLLTCLAYQLSRLDYRISSNRGQAPTIGRWSISPDGGTGSTRRGRSFDGVGGARTAGMILMIAGSTSKWSRLIEGTPYWRDSRLVISSSLTKPRLTNALPSLPPFCF